MGQTKANAQANAETERKFGFDESAKASERTIVAADNLLGRIDSRINEIKTQRTAAPDTPYLAYAQRPEALEGGQSPNTRTAAASQLSAAQRREALENDLSDIRKEAARLDEEILTRRGQAKTEAAKADAKSRAATDEFNDELDRAQAGYQAFIASIEAVLDAARQPGLSPEMRECLLGEAERVIAQGHALRETVQALLQDSGNGADEPQTGMESVAARETTRVSSQDSDNGVGKPQATEKNAAARETTQAPPQDPDDGAVIERARQPQQEIQRTTARNQVASIMAAARDMGHRNPLQYEKDVHVAVQLAKTFARIEGETRRAEKTQSELVKENRKIFEEAVKSFALKLMEGDIVQDARAFLEWQIQNIKSQKDEENKIPNLYSICGGTARGGQEEPSLADYESELQPDKREFAFERLDAGDQAFVEKYETTENLTAHLKTLPAEEFVQLSAAYEGLGEQEQTALLDALENLSDPKELLTLLKKYENVLPQPIMLATKAILADQKGDNEIKTLTGISGKDRRDAKLGNNDGSATDVARRYAEAA
ncbi:hypothetical protein NO2_1520 [Candidatus Termititenax persephonae]|uniref:Uncharacterized protein n=1 Tax=Candidatus Termititenax persephonae TaxID=2218525 RepID=A0A388TIM4_9BACT|nr:hypothetical protein NO2_1520 [Candidatus Termititenax persephonae]